MSTEEERFWSKVDRRDPDDCWLWTGADNGDGYGRFGNGYAHIYSYRKHKRRIPRGYEIDHLCRNRRCVNPRHLEAVPHIINVLRGMSLSAQRARQTHCKRGHPLSGDNLIKQGRRRMCKICRDQYREDHREQAREYKRARDARKKSPVTLL